MPRHFDWLLLIMQRELRVGFRFEGRAAQEVVAWITLGNAPEIGPVVIRNPASDELGIVLGRAIHLVLDHADEAPAADN